MLPHPTVSLCMIVKNEERLLPGCLESVLGRVDEIIVVDTGSTDGTVETASRYGARVFSFTWTNDYSAARNESLKHATGEWILQLDADERLVAPDRNPLRAAATPDVDAFLVPIRNRLRQDSSTILNAHHNIRFFRNYPGLTFTGPIHESVEPFLTAVGATVRQAPFFIDHLGYDLDPASLGTKLAAKGEILANLVAREPRNAQALYYLGNTLASLGKTGESRDAFKRAAEIQEASPGLRAMILNSLAYLETAEGRHNQAMEAAAASLQSVPRQNGARLFLATALFNLGNHRGALPYLREVRAFMETPAETRATSLSIEFPVQESGVLLALAICETEAGDPGEGVRLARKYLDKHGEDPRMRAIVNASKTAERPSPARIKVKEAPALSVCMIVKNEGSQLEGALSNFSRFADEIVVVDTGSADDTRAIALRHTRHVFDFSWCDDFSAARNRSIEYATGRYILWMDADDRVEDAHINHIHQLKNHFDGRKAFYFVLEDMDADGPTASFHQLRCVPRLDNVRFFGAIHERLRIRGLTPVTTDIVVRHHGYTHSAIHLQKVKRNLAILEKERAAGRDDATIHFYLGLTFEKLGLLDRAIEFMTTAAARLEAPSGYDMGDDPDVTTSVEAHVHLARLHRRAGHVREAEQHAVTALSMAPPEAGFHIRLAGLFQSLQRHGEALECFGKARSLPFSVGFNPSPPPPEEGTLLVHTALSHLCLGRKAQAMQCMRRALKEGMNACEAWELLGFTALDAGEPGFALLAYDMATEAGRLSSQSYNLLGGLYLTRGLRGKAREAYEKAIEVDPGYDRALVNLAFMDMEDGDPAHARRLIRQVSAKGAEDLDVIALDAFLANEEGRASIERRLREDPRFEALKDVTDGRAFCARTAEIMRARGNAKAADLFKSLVGRWHTGVSGGR